MDDITYFMETSIIDTALNKIKNVGKIEIKKRTPEEVREYKESNEYKNLTKKLLGVFNPMDTRHRLFSPNPRLAGFNRRTLNHRAYALTVSFLSMISAYWLPMPVQIAGIFYFLLIHNSDALQDFLDALEQLLRSKSTTMYTFYRKIDKLVDDFLPH